ncbi:MAG: hypothetical protein JWL60_2197 [Gemmatimonadetes bacterium]|nr:hypothetical protein [Gemmatimonadota bacterium]
MARPGPGKGWRPTISSGRPSSRPTLRTSSLNSSRSGSMSANCIPGFSPPTLWCVLIVTDAPPVGELLSITSGYRVPCTRNFACVPAVAVASSNTSMKVWPIARRFASGSSMPARAARKRADASTVTSRMPRCAAIVRSTCSRSWSRRSPVSTNTQVSWSPIARCTNAAATELSTPPESPQITCAPPTCARIRATWSSMNAPGVQFAVAPQTPNRKLDRISPPRGVCATSGWNCTPWIGRDSCSNAATGLPSLEAVTRNPGGACSMWSPWLIHTVAPSSAVKPRNSALGPAGAICARPYSRRPPRVTVAPCRCAMSCIP